MFVNSDIFIIAIGAITITILMVVAMTYITIEGMDSSIHSPNSKADLEEDDSLPAASRDEDLSPARDSPDSRA